IARFVERRLGRLDTPPYSREPIRLTLITDATPGFDQPELVQLGPDGPAEDFGARAAMLALERRVGGPELWGSRGRAGATGAGRPPLASTPFGVARCLPAQPGAQDSRRLFGLVGHGRAPRQSAEAVCRQAAADREGRLPLYECFMCGSEQAANVPEYAAL